MNIKERIANLGTYFHSMNVAAENGIIYVLVQFPKGWGCSETTEYNFNVKSVQDETPGFFYFFADLEVGFDKIFDAIEYNINFNKEAQAKVNLLRTKIEELKTIFEEEDIDTLNTLEFKIKKKKIKGNKNKSTNEDKTSSDEIVEENNMLDNSISENSEI
jgi:hypothetical protein